MNVNVLKKALGSKGLIKTGREVDLLEILINKIRSNSNITTAHDVVFNTVAISPWEVLSQKTHPFIFILTNNLLILAGSIKAQIFISMFYFNVQHFHLLIYGLIESVATKQ